jgi:hypothetical protein
MKTVPTIPIPEPSTEGGVTVYVPMATVSEMNSREHRWAKIKRKQSQQMAVILAFAPVRKALARLAPPFVVRMTRYGARTLDDDNLHASFKATRDQVAKLLNVDDGDRARVRWVPDQMTLAELRRMSGVTFAEPTVRICVMTSSPAPDATTTGRE